MPSISRCLAVALGLGPFGCAVPPVPPVVPPGPVAPEQTRAAVRDALALLAEAESDGHLSASECESVASAFRAVYDPRTPPTADGLFDAGVIWERCQQPQRAAAAYRDTIAAVPGHASAHNNLGVLLWRAGERDAAGSSFERAVKGDPGATAPRNNLSAVLRERYVETGATADFDRAEDALRNALAVDSANPISYENLARLYYDRGRIQDRSYLLLADLVITQGTRILEADGQPSAELYNLRGLLFFEEDDPVSALRAFDHATELDATHAEAHLNIAMIALRFRDYSTAEASLQQALEDQRHHGNVDALLGLGVAQRGQRHYDDAEQTLVRANELAAKDPRALYNLGILYHEHIAPVRSQVVDERAGTTTFDEGPYLDAQRFFERFTKAAADRYPQEVADARQRVSSIDQFLADIKELEDLQAAQARMEAEARRQQQEERTQLLEIERRARQAHQADQGS